MRRCFRIPLAVLAMVVALAAVGATDARSDPKGPVVSKGANAGSVAVDVNSATVEQLVAVPGIGEALARRIVEFRSKNGPFQRVDDLLKVRGIGEKSLEKLRPHLRAGNGK